MPNNREKLQRRLLYKTRRHNHRII
jgi:hypothetical protein